MLPGAIAEANHFHGVVIQVQFFAGAPSTISLRGLTKLGEHSTYARRYLQSTFIEKAGSMKIKSLLGILAIALLPVSTHADTTCPLVTIGSASVYFKKETAYGRRVVPDSLSVQLTAAGRPLRDSRLVFLTLDSVVDTAGKDLVPAPGTVARDYLFSGSNSLMMPGDPVVLDFRRGEKGRPNDLANFYLQVLAPSGAATTIAQLKGTAHFYLPNRDPNSVLTISDIPLKLGQKIYSSATQGGEVSVTLYSEEQFAKLINRPERAGSKGPDVIDGLALHIEGISAEVLDIRVVDANDQEIASSAGNRAPMKNYAAELDGEIRRVFFKDPLPERAKLTIFLRTSKSILPVPFKLDDLKSMNTENR